MKKIIATLVAAGTAGALVLGVVPFLAGRAIATTFIAVKLGDNRHKVIVHNVSGDTLDVSIRIRFYSGAGRTFNIEDLAAGAYVRHTYKRRVKSWGSPAVTIVPGPSPSPSPSPSPLPASPTPTLLAIWLPPGSIGETRVCTPTSIAIGINEHPVGSGVSVYVSMDPAFTPDDSTAAVVSASGFSGQVVVTALHDGTPLLPATTYYVRDIEAGYGPSAVLVVTTSDGQAPPQPASSWHAFSYYATTDAYGNVTWGLIYNVPPPPPPHDPCDTYAQEQRMYISTDPNFTPGPDTLFPGSWRNGVVINEAGYWGGDMTAWTAANLGQTFYARVVMTDADGSSTTTPAWQFVAGSASP